MKIILFDFDGVIVDTFEICYKIMTSIYKTPPDREGYRRFFYGNIYEAKDVMEKEGIKVGDKVTADDPFFKRYIPLLMKQKPIDNILEVLKELSKNHQLVIVSSTIDSPIVEYLKKYDLSDFFTKIYGTDVHKSKVKKIKMVLNEFQIKPEKTFFVTDTLGDIREATKVGIKSIAVSWGFHSTETLQKGNPVAIVNKPEELLTKIQNS